jgi:hypothetical protein
MIWSVQRLDMRTGVRAMAVRVSARSTLVGRRRKLKAMMNDGYIEYVNELLNDLHHQILVSELRRSLTTFAGNSPCCSPLRWQLQVCATGIVEGLELKAV